LTTIDLPARVDFFWRWWPGSEQEPSGRHHKRQRTRGHGMRILLSAFACDPEEGSEAGLGWSWAYQLAKAGHDVLVFARDEHRPAIEKKLSSLNLPNLRFEYPVVRSVRFWMPVVDVLPYYICWQWSALFRARQLNREKPFDVVQHITYAVFRHASYLYLVNAPFIFGPVGGGEHAPAALLVSMSAKARRYETLRNLVNLAPRLFPFWRLMLRMSARVVVKTEQTRACLTRGTRARAVVCLENMVTEEPYLAGETRRASPMQFLFAGRLVSWKGAHLAIRAVAKAGRQVPVQLTIVGKGEEELALKELVERMGLQDCVKFIPWVPKAELMAMFASHDALLFPSMHDSGGTVVMEAITHGKPVICLDLGGPAVTVDAHCARVVNTQGKTEQEVIEGLTDAIVEVCRMPDSDWEKMRLAAVERARYFSADRVIARVYGPLLDADVSAGSTYA